MFLYLNFLSSVLSKMYKQVKINAYDCKCERCGHKWRAHENVPVSCAKCKSRSWNIPKNATKRTKEKKNNQN